MNKLFPFSMIAIGLVLLYMGYEVANSNSFVSIFTHFFRGRPTREAIWMLVSGGIALTSGLAYLAKGK
jgi:hypothetical protein